MQGNEVTVAKQIEQYKVIAIVRRVCGKQLLALAEALYEGGIRLLEVTFDAEDEAALQKTPEALRTLQRAVPQLTLGAGTVLDIAQAEAAADAGAGFVVSPNVDEAVIARTKALGLVSIPGAMTPTEMVAAHKAGADFVKVFPVASLGAEYMRHVMAPLSHIRFVATAGVDESNLGAYLQMGMVAAGISGRLTEKGLIDAGNFAELTRRAKVFAELAQAHGGS